VLSQGFRPGLPATARILDFAYPPWSGRKIEFRCVGSCPYQVVLRVGEPPQALRATAHAQKRVERVACIDEPDAPTDLTPR
jgi:hypothetical protein